MASSLPTQEHFDPSAGMEDHVYSLCVFLPGYVVPWVQLLDADTDAAAIALATPMRSSTMRELWCRHRLVAVIPPAC